MKKWNIEDALRVVNGNLNPLYVWDNEKQEGHREEGLWLAIEEMDVNLKDALFTASILSDGIGRGTDWLQGDAINHIEPGNRSAVLDFVVEHQLKYQADFALIWCFNACRVAVELDLPVNPSWVSRLALESLTCEREDWLKVDKRGTGFNDGWAVSAKKWLAEYFAKA